MATARIQLRRDTASNWTSTNPVLASGELGLETDTGKIKVGNNSSAWTALDYTVYPLAFSDLTTTPTTISGYGITDAFDGAFSSLTGTPTTLSGYGITDAAPLASPTFTGTPAAPTATSGTNTTQIATTAFVQQEVTAAGSYNDASVDTHLNTSTATTNEVLSWNGTDYDWVAQSSGGIALTDLSVTTNTAGTAALSYNNTTGVFSYTPPNLSSYLTAETNDLTSAVTWANVPDANITQSSVTQHQAALSITESQISDLQSYLTSVALNDVSDVTITSLSSGQILKYNGTAWVNAADSGGIALTDLSVTTNTAGTAALSYNNTTGVFSYTPPDLSSYLTSYTVTESDVTTHQAALSITESQISDLQTYLTAETNDLTSAVTWANVPNANITESSVTQHQAALSITESQISDLQTYLTGITGQSIENLSDVSSMTPTDGQVLTWDNTNSYWYAASPSGGSYNNSSVDSHLNTSTAATNEVLSWNGSDYDWVAQSGGGGGIALTDLSVTTNTAGTAALSYNNSTGVFSYTPPDLSSYLTAETNDLSAAVTWANVPNANITESSVTQHQAALSITSTQVSDFGEAVDDQVNTLLQAGLGVDLTYDDANNELTIDSNHVEVNCTNNSGASISIGTPVYQTGVSGNNITIAPADADDANKMPAIGLTTSTIANGNEGTIVILGVVTGLDTSTFAAGDTVYIGTTPGSLTTTPPTGESGLIQNFGRVLKVNASSGSIAVMGAGRANAVANLNDGNIFIGNSSNQAEARALVEADISDFGTYLTGITGENIGSLSDVTITSVAAGEVLRYSGSAWVNSDPIAGRFSIVNSSSSAYVFTGSGTSSDSNPTLYLTRGQTYEFVVNASGHPFYIKTVSGTGTGNAYSDGVTNNGAETGTVTLAVQMDAPDTLYYNCSAHSAMAGTIYILDSTVNLSDFSVTTNSVGTAALSYSNGVFTYTPPDLSSYLTAEADTLNSITGRGNSTTNSITVGNATVTGNLTVQGTTTTLETATLNVEDKNITINYSTGDSSGSADGAGITIQDAVNSTTDATLLWDATGDKFEFSHAVDVTGNITVSGTVDGRDLATDGTKLDGIEASADVTDATNVAAAGAVMDGDFTANGFMKRTGAGTYTIDTNTYLTSISVGGLSDITVTNVADNEVLAYDSSSSSWINQTASEAGLATASQGTLADSALQPADLSVTTNSVGTAALSYSNGVFTYTPPDLSSYLTAETNDLTAAVTWANVPNANITQASVTQHQAALSITESQISDFGTYLTAITGENIGSLSDVTITTVADNEVLAYDNTSSAWINQTAAEAGLATSAQGTLADSALQPADLSVTTNTAGTAALSYSNGVFTYTPPDLSSYLTAETNDLTSAVTWANVPNANITQSSVTQHQAALSITESQISDLQSYLTGITGQSIENLSDVTTMTPTDGQVLTWDNTNSYWYAADASGGGGGASVSVSETAPSSPSSGDLWFDPNALKTYVYYNDGDSNQWVQANPTASGGGSGGVTTGKAIAMAMIFGG